MSVAAGLLVAAIAAGLLLASSAPAGLSGTNSYKFLQKPIPDGKKARIVNINYDAGSAVVDDANAFLRVKHPRTSDLIVSLKHAGEKAVLSRRDTAGRNLGSKKCFEQPMQSDEFPDFTIFNDDSATPIADGAAPYDDTAGFQPRQPLTVFDGVEMSGRWTLTVKDVRDGKAGVLQCARLRILGIL